MDGLAGGPLCCFVSNVHLWPWVGRTKAGTGLAFVVSHPSQVRDGWGTRHLWRGMGRQRQRQRQRKKQIPAGMTNKKAKARAKAGLSIVVAHRSQNRKCCTWTLNPLTRLFPRHPKARFPSRSRKIIRKGDDMGLGYIAL